MQTVSTAKFNFDFLKYRHLWFALSLGYIACGLAAYFFRGGINYHVEFTGGAEVRLSFEKSYDISRVREKLAIAGFKDAPIQTIGATGREFIIRLHTADNTVESLLNNAFASEGDNAMRIDGVTLVGAEVGSETTWNAFKAVFISLLILLLYIAVRFELKYGLGAVVALAHDLLAVMAFIVITGEPFSLNVLAAILAMLGYSLNDTIIIFSKIRQNKGALHGQDDMVITNTSINQVLMRTILTSLTTTLSVLAIMLLGGEALWGFAVTMFVGIIVGTYSSIYIASPVMLFVGRTFQQ